MLVVLSICFFLGIATRAETEVTESKISPEKGTYEPLIKPEEEPALYKTEIKQITPKSGITTGHIIAYGHYIKPPYKLEIKSDTMLFINGVQIFPVLPSNYEIDKKRREKLRLDDKYGEANRIAGPYLKRMNSLYDEIKRVYKVIEQKEGRDEAIDSIFKLIKAETLIVKTATTFVGEDDCLLRIGYFLPGYSESPEDLLTIGLELKGRNPTSGYVNIPHFNVDKKEVDYYKERLEKELKKGDLIFRTSFNRGLNDWPEYRFWRISETLKNKDLSEEEKIQKLNEVLLLVEDSKELLYNFYPSEWPIKNIEDK
jgi:hypothetical protein